MLAMPRTVSPSEPAQPALAGFDAPVQTPAQAAAAADAPADELPKLAVMGHLAAPACVRHTADGAVIVEALVLQQVHHHPRALPVLASHHMADRGCFADTHDAAMALAARLLAGVEVMCTGRGLEIRHHQGREVLRFIHSDAIAATDALLASHQPGGTAP